MPMWKVFKLIRCCDKLKQIRNDAFVNVKMIQFLTVKWKQIYNPLNSCLQVNFWEAPNHAEFSNFLLQFKNQRSGSKTVCGFSINYLYFERNYDLLKSKGPCFLLNKNVKFNKNEMESKMGNPTHSLREMNHVLQLE